MRVATTVPGMAENAERKNNRTRGRSVSIPLDIDADLVKATAQRRTTLSSLVVEALLKAGYGTAAPELAAGTALLPGEVPLPGVDQ